MWKGRVGDRRFSVTISFFGGLGFIGMSLESSHNLSGGGRSGCVIRGGEIGGGENSG
jgi:hypothetical protein